MEDQGIVTRIFSFLDRHHWVSFIIAVAILLITTYVALRFGHGMSTLLGTLLR